MEIGFAIDDAQGLSDAEELRLLTIGAELGYSSAWTPSRADADAFDRCVSWHAATGLPVGISAVPAAGQPAEFYAERARRVWEATNGSFTLAVGSGHVLRPAQFMRRYLAELRQRLPADMPLYVAALGPLMLEVAAEMADGVALNWCTEAHVTWSRKRLQESERRAGRPMPVVVEYIRTCVDPNSDLARRTVGAAAGVYALGPPAYRRHFEKMGFADELRRLESSQGSVEESSLSSVGASGSPGEAWPRFERLAHGLDLAIVRILAVRSDPFESARRALEECSPDRHQTGAV